MKYRVELTIARTVEISDEKMALPHWSFYDIVDEALGETSDIEDWEEQTRDAWPARCLAGEGDDMRKGTT